MKHLCTVYLYMRSKLLNNFRFHILCKVSTLYVWLSLISLCIYWPLVYLPQHSPLVPIRPLLWSFEPRSILHLCSRNRNEQIIFTGKILIQTHSKHRHGETDVMNASDQLTGLVMVMVSPSRTDSSLFPGSAAKSYNTFACT